MCIRDSIDGQQLTPASFAETNSTTGQWIPKDTSALTFGTNGFRLKFNDNSNTTATTLGKDSSGNGNNYTPNNFYVAVGSAVNVKNNDYARLPTSVSADVITRRKITLRFANFTSTFGSIAAFSACNCCSSGVRISAFEEICVSTSYAGTSN